MSHSCSEAHYSKHSGFRIEEAHFTVFESSSIPVDFIPLPFCIAYLRRAHGLVVVGRAVRAGGDAVQGVPRVGHPAALEPRALERLAG